MHTLRTATMFSVALRPMVRPVATHAIRPLLRTVSTTVSAPDTTFNEDKPLSPDDPMSFIEKAKAFGANALLGAFTHVGNRFDRTLANMEILQLDTAKGRVLCRLPVDEGVQNGWKTLHGGCIATCVDVAGTLALLAKDPTKPGVSVELSTSYCSAAKAGTTVLIEGR